MAGKTYNTENLDQMVNSINFPISKEDLINQYGNDQIQWSKDEVVALKDIVEDVDTDCFNSPTELEDLLTK